MRSICFVFVLLGLAQCGPAIGPAAPPVQTTAPQTNALLAGELNAARASNGRSPLKFNAALQRAAESHAQDMARRGYFDHVSPDGRTLADRLSRAGYRYCFAAENIAQGQGSPAEVMRAWMGSAGHRHNNLSRGAREFGAARAAGNTWVLVFGTPC